MSQMRVMVGQSTWGIDSKNTDTIVQQVKSAMENGTVVALPLLDGGNRPITVYLNGKAADAVAVDLGEDPRPSEIS
jgi:VCBS repeat-containing protein